MAKKENFKNSEKQKVKGEQTESLTLENLRERLTERKVLPFEQLPNLDLYMDQVISIMSRQTEGENHRSALTSSMINNYTKQGVLPRAEGKRYNRDHLVDLTILVYLKEVLPIVNIGELLQLLAREGDPQWRYEKMSEILENESNNIMKLLPEDADDTQELVLQILSMGLISYITRQTALSLLDLAKRKTQEDDNQEG
ncbi:MAG: DUF1836 domain-containing protein [Eubacteriales bacterium]|nr:DUF1836 domain-containing protein [Eubacteriales bacterium]